MTQEKLLRVLGTSVKYCVDDENGLSLYLKEETFLTVVKYLKNHILTNYSELIGITAVDYPERENRFEVVYFFLSVWFKKRIILKVCLDAGSSISSLNDIFKGSVWYEREVWDMFGVIFENSQDKRRILTDYGFDSHPLRKDFPLIGYTECVYDESKKRVVLEQVEITQNVK